MAKNIFEVKTEEGNLNVRAAGDTSAAVVAKLAKGALVEVLSVENGWAKVEVNGKSGYCAAAYLAQAENAYEVTTNSKNLNIRAAASTEGAILGTAAKGDVLKVTGINGDWAEVEYNGKVAYASLQYLSQISDTDINLAEAAAQSSKLIDSTDLFA
ncbi:MAG: SH3 domain-containing protein [Paludibacteraceae bacterium]|nr:SH3 domain-containing protein [Candidatus Physcocola equi]MCQ2234540.1 SH3 domain-containing protein [Paludibacteraceae bacterium]